MGSPGASRARHRFLAGALLSLGLSLSACGSSSDGATDPADAGSNDGASGEGGNPDSAAADSGSSDAASDATDAGGTDAGDAPSAEAGVTCTKVAHIGDSLTAYTVDPLTQAYAAVGVTAEIDAYGGRAILQKLPADPKTGKQAALDFNAAGFDGCWVVALGTNDTANIAAGAWYTRADAIDEMMKAVDPTATAPVMWVNTFTTKTSGYWSNDNMKLWNEALNEAVARWPNLKVFDWSAVAATGSAPFADGIHHTTAGYTVRNQAIAEALVGLYPPPS